MYEKLIDGFIYREVTFVIDLFKSTVQMFIYQCSHGFAEKIP